MFDFKVIDNLEEMLENVTKSHKALIKYVYDLLVEGKLEEAQAALLEYIEG